MSTASRMETFSQEARIGALYSEEATDREDLERLRADVEEGRNYPTVKGSVERINGRADERVKEISDLLGESDSTLDDSQRIRLRSLQRLSVGLRTSSEALLQRIDAEDQTVPEPVLEPESPTVREVVIPRPVGGETEVIDEPFVVDPPAEVVTPEPVATTIPPGPRPVAVAVESRRTVGSLWPLWLLLAVLVAVYLLATGRWHTPEDWVEGLNGGAVVINTSTETTTSPTATTPSTTEPSPTTDESATDFTELNWPPSLIHAGGIVEVRFRNVDTSRVSKIELTVSRGRVAESNSLTGNLQTDCSGVAWNQTATIATSSAGKSYSFCYRAPHSSGAVETTTTVYGPDDHGHSVPTNFFVRPK